MSDDPSPAPPATAQASGPRRVVPVAIVIVATVVLAGLQYARRAELMSPANVFLATVSTVGASAILVFLWFVFLSQASRKTRLRVGVVGLVVAALAVASVRVEGVSGDIEPRFRFRWLPHPDETLGKLETADGESVNLADTTPADYPQFLGPDRRATLTGLNLERDWAAHPPKELWRQPIGAGWSSFAIVGPFAVTQEQRDTDELITCYEVDTGRARWQHATPVRFEETLAGIGPRATPTVYEGKVYAMGAMGHLTCLDGATGRKLWQHDVVTENSATPPIWGKSCSPLVHENRVIVSAGGTSGNSLVAFDKDSGEQVWSGGDGASSYSSPTLMTLAGVPQIVIANAREIVAHDPADGRVLWTHEWPGDVAPDQHASPTVAQPVLVGDDRILLTKGYGIGSALCQIKHDGDQWSVEELWRTNNLKTKFTNAVIRDGHAYALDEGVLECVAIDKGRRAWKRGRYGHGQVVLVDDLLLVQSETGDVALVLATPEGFHEVARMHAIAGTSWNPPALSGRRLLVRSNLEAACYELPAASP